MSQFTLALIYTCLKLLLAYHLGATYDISNKHRLGYSERDLVQDMYDGVKAMIEKEKSL